MEDFYAGVMVVFDAAVLVVGLCLVYAAWKMKKTGEISALIATRDEIATCRNKSGFIRYICNKMTGLGCLAAAFGAASLLGRVWEAAGGAYVRAAVQLLFLGGCFWLLSQIRKGREYFF